MIRSRLDSPALGEDGVNVSQPAICATPIRRKVDSTGAPIVPLDKANLPAVWTFCSSGEYERSNH